jgi:hypothetical protein
MKFLPPEEEIRAQLRELTSQTRRLRADLQGMIDDKAHADSAFDRHRLKREVRLTASSPKDAPVPRPRRGRQKPHKPTDSR